MASQDPNIQQFLALDAYVLPSELDDSPLVTRA